MEKVEVAEISLQIFQRFHFKDFIFNIMHADHLVKQGARSLAHMASTKLVFED